MSPGDNQVAVIGGGLAGNLLAICLARNGFGVEVIEVQAPYTEDAQTTGRSINLALAARGIAALREQDAFSVIEPLLIPMIGRELHEIGQAPQLAPYGQSSDECIYSISRSELNYRLYCLASERHGVRYRFNTHCVGIDATTLHPLLESNGETVQLPIDTVFATDGAGSTVRRALQDLGLLEATEELLDHGYKELAIAPSAANDFALNPNALHIWPRSDYMLIALPNTDRSFTATLFLANAGVTSFTTINTTNVEAFFNEQFPDAVALFADLPEQFANNPTGILGTVRCNPWHYADKYLLIGDAAHAIVPFHGQGMNAAFEDVGIINELLRRKDSFGALFAGFESRRRRDANAIADMAIENYNEMRAAVRDPKFHLRRAAALELERRFPGRFIPRYSMVMFHPEISYADAQSRGQRQLSLLENLTTNANSLAEIDFSVATQFIERELSSAP